MQTDSYTHKLWRSFGDTVLLKYKIYLCMNYYRCTERCTNVVSLFNEILFLPLALNPDDACSRCQHDDIACSYYCVFVTCEIQSCVWPKKRFMMVWFPDALSNKKKGKIHPQKCFSNFCMFSSYFAAWECMRPDSSLNHCQELYNVLGPNRRTKQTNRTQRWALWNNS